MAFGNVKGLEDAVIEGLTVGITLRLLGNDDAIVEAVANIGQYNATLGYALDTFFDDPSEENKQTLEDIFRGNIDVEQWAEDEGLFDE